MKKITLLLILFVTTISIAQEKEDKPLQDVDKHHEVKMNAISLIGFKWVDVAYEYLIDEESSFGTSILFSLDKQNDFDTYKTFSITPYYRRYFSSKYARGFFIEGFGMLNTFRENYHDYINGGFGGFILNNKKQTDFAIGISTGAKFVTKKGFTAEIYLGLGRNLFNSSNHLREVVGRGGISLGYRF